jgi:predicted AlkP superfamily pyrophosphatase or phosphodiesterase
MSNRVCVIDFPGLSRDLLSAVPAGSALGKWLSGHPAAGLTPSFPAVTCSVQATLTTGTPPAKHGMVANGIATYRSADDAALVDATNFASYRREVSFWEQSNQFVQARRFWQDDAGRSKWKTALLFFQNSMPGFAGEARPAADIVLTPKPDHGPDGKLTSLCWSAPGELVGELFREFGPFPLMNYWGPLAGIASSAWIGKAAAHVWSKHQPRLQWTYIPHLDYDLQRFGPHSPQATQAVADAAGAVEPLVQAVLNDGGKIVVLSEYSVSAVTRVAAPNRALAEAGLLVTRQTADGEIVDYENSAAFAMVDHQTANVYLQDAGRRAEAEKALWGVAGVSVLPGAATLPHRRSGDLLLVADPDAWFDYRWWSDPAKAPAFARMVDIHRKPGYDPLELFWDPAAKGIIQDPARIKGSHGRVGLAESVIAAEGLTGPSIDATEVAAIVTRLLGES